MSKISLASKLGQNLIINPRFDIWQRGIGPFIDTGYTVDRFSITTSRKLHLDQSIDVPSWSSSKYSIELTNASVVTAPSTYTTRLVHRVEGYNIRKIKNKNMVLSFNVKGNFSGQSSITIFNNGEDQCLVTTYNITTNWTRVNLKIKKNDFSVGNWNLGSGLGFDISWNLESSADLQTATLDEWLSSLAFGHAGDYRFNDNAGDKVWISDVSLHEGIEEIPFEKLDRDFVTELELCQRYFEKSYDLDTEPGTITDNGSFAVIIPSDAFIHNRRFRVIKRVTPTLTFYNPNSGALDTWRNVTLAADVVASERGGYTGTNGFTPQGVGASASLISGHWTADAEL